ncbi:MAG TPA: transcription antitermination factor NusB [Thermoleophilia bacterium]|nr:transcription antitermination factor NusB [Thermoleophilia bacterium]HQG04005.1 transcription antitermination factor NusB [Thermoleophilia bacterium]HQG55264.1 transcription antitermination factor NusB [Thermoleophilia bacterium]HQJ97182.1 transcription antitermination factor NusB [Thermoleophilia bacterium]
MTPASPSRRQARRDALFLLYQREVTGRPLDELVAGHRLRESYPPDDFTLAVVAGVVQRLDDLDARLRGHATDWPLERLAPLERSVLRLALYELESGLTPPEVAIDEAVRLARRYASDEAGALVNGILGAIAREREAHEGRGEIRESSAAAREGAGRARGVAATDGEARGTKDGTRGEGGGRGD